MHITSEGLMIFCRVLVEGVNVMEFRTIGDRQVVPLGLGGWAIGGEVTCGGVNVGWSGTDDAASLRALHMAFEAGVNFVDTSDAYGAGHSERLIGQAVADRREDILVANQIWAPFRRAIT